VIFDTSVLIGGERGTLDLDSLLESLGSETIAIAAITASELLHGSHRARQASVRIRRLAFVDALLEVIPVAAFGLPEARRHAEIWAELTRTGKMIGAHDLLIAATAVARGDAVATLNQKDFKRVPGLNLVPME